MVLRFVEWAIGPSGVKILDWLEQRGLWVPGLVLAVTLLAMAFPGARASVVARLESVRERLGLAPTPEEREHLEELRRRVQSRRGGKSSGKDKGEEQKGT